MSLPATDDFDDAVANELRMVAFLLQGGNQTRASESCLRIARLYGQRGQTQDALAIARWASQLDPRVFDASRLPGLLDAMGPDALLLFRDAAQSNLSAGRDALAIAVLRVLTEHLPTCATTRLLLAEALRRQGEIDGAIAELWAAAEVFRASHRYDGYIEMLRHVLEIDPKDTAALEELTRAEIEQGEYGSAVETATAWLRVRPGNRRGRILLAQALACHGRAPTALGVLRSVVRELAMRDRHEEIGTLLAQALTWCPTHEAFCAALEELTTGDRGGLRARDAQGEALPLRVIAS